jgi:ribose 5-phosphate isomerase A
MTTQHPKSEAARVAARLVESGMNVGLGSGSTSELIVRHLGERVRNEQLRFVGVATSIATAELASACGVMMTDLDAVETLDLDLDGADEVDPQFRLIKGRGGALLHEKIVAAASRRRVIVVTADKQVERLGMHFPLPVEVSPFGLKHTQHAIRNLGAVPVLRRAPDGSPATTDEGHSILDCRFEAIPDPAALDTELHRIPGVFATGLFIELCDLLIVGRPDGVEELEPPPRRRST